MLTRSCNADETVRICAMFSPMPLVYCDHNFVITAHDADKKYQDCLRRLASEGKVTYVVLTSHWLEMARDKDPVRGLRVAQFADSLNPLWLCERRGIQRREVEHAFFAFVEVPHQNKFPVGTMAEVITDLTGTDVETASRYRDSGAFVAHMRTLGEKHPLELNIRKNFEVQQKNAEAYRAGKYSEEILRLVDGISIESLLPDKTPGGVAIAREAKARFLDSCKNSDFPSIAVEVALTKDGWQMNRILNDRTFRDSQHVIAIPYVDLFLTDDGVLSNAIVRIKPQFTFPTAEVITRAEFDRRFL